MLKSGVLMIVTLLMLSAAALAGELPLTPFIRIAAEMHSARITGAASDAEGKLVATASYDKTVKLWDPATGKLLRTLRPPLGTGTEGSLHSVALSPDGKRVAAGGFTGSSWDNSYCVYLFDLGRGEIISRLTGFKQQIHRLLYSRDGKQLAVTVAGGNGIHVFSAEDNRLLFRDMDYQGNIFAVEYAANGNLVAASDRGEIRVYAPDGSVRLKTRSEQAQRIFSLAVSPDSSKVALAYEWEERKVVDLLDLKDGSWLSSLNGLQGALQSVAWSRDGSHIWVAGAKGNRSENKLLFKWSLASRSLDETMALPVKQGVRKLLALSNGSILFVAPFSGFGVITDQGGVHHAVVVGSAKRGGKQKERTVETSGEIQFFHHLAAPDFQKNHDAFKISADAGQVMFSYERYGQGKALFDLRQRRLISDGVPETGLLSPLVTANGIDLQHWDSNTPAAPKLNGRRMKGFGGWEFSSCLAVRPDGQGFVIGSTHFLRHYNKKGKLLWKRRNIERAWDVNISADNTTLVASFDDGTIRWFDLVDGHERYALYLHPDRKRWVLWLPDGYFDHGPDSESLVGFVVNKRTDQAAEIIRLSRMYDLFYRPDIVEKALLGQDISGHLKRLEQRAGVTAAPVTGGEQTETVAPLELPAPHLPSRVDLLVNQATLPPHIRFITSSGTVQSAEVVISAELCDDGGGIGNLTLFLNQVPIAFEKSRGLVRQSKTAAACIPFQHTITLKHDRNTISLVAYNQANTIESRRESIELLLPAPAVLRPRLHVLTVAVNNYRDGDLRLKYPLNDAEELAATISRKAQGLFSEVKLYQLHDEEVTKQKLAAMFAGIGAKTSREDVFLLFLAGHGVSEELDGRYYFLPVDFRYTGPESIVQQGVSMDDFKQWLSGIQALKSLILLDTCSSGSFVEAIASRGVTEKTALSKLARAVGRATIAASSKNQIALEGYQGHGVFSYSLLQGINGKAAAESGEITINRLATFVEETLPALTYKKWGYEQIPQKSLIGNDFPIGMR